MTFYNTFEGSSSRLNDSIIVYILPIINIYSFSCNFISVIILSKSKLIGDINNYMLVESIITSLYCLISSFISLIRCGSMCPWGYDYYSKIYELYVFIYMGESIEFFKFLINLIMSIIKYRSFSIQSRNRTYDKKKFCLIIFFSIMISFMINILPTFCGKTILEIANYEKNQSANNSGYKKQILFILDRNKSKNDSFNSSINIIFPFLLLILLIIILIINIMISLELKKFHARKLSTIAVNNLGNLSNKDIRKTKLVISYCINAMLGNLTNKLQFILFYFLDSYSFGLFDTIGNGLLWISHGNIFFINFFFNKEFYETFIEMIGQKNKKSQESKIFDKNNSTQLTTTL
jgi:hypothetical protein